MKSTLDLFFLCAYKWRMAAKKKRPKVNKEERLGIRLSPEQKEMVERKARNRGLSASSFLLSLAIAAPEAPAIS